MSIAVIIPFHNAYPFLEKAVQSCLQQKEVAEILLVNDHSTDKSQELAKGLACQYPTIRLLTMPGEAPKGPGAARNLGIQHSRSEFIAFLDADDVYTAQRFTKALTYLEQNPDLDGYYVPTALYDVQLKELLERKGIWSDIPPEALFVELILGRSGHFNTPGILLRSSVFQKTGYFNEKLLWHQDTEFWLRVAFHCLLAGDPEGPELAKIRQHPANHSHEAGMDSRILLWKTVLNYFKTQKTGAYIWYLLLLRLGMESYRHTMKKEYFTLLPLFFRYPQYFWIWFRKWIHH